MRKWPGMEENATPVGDGIRTLQNVSLLTEGELTRRPVLAGRRSTTGLWKSMAGFERLGIAPWLFGATDTKIYAHNLTTSTTIDAAGGATFTNSTYGATFARCANRLFITNGVDSPTEFFDGAGNYAAVGVSAPSTPLASLESTYSTLTYTGAAYGNGTFVAVGPSGAVATSATGITWTIRTSGTTNNWQAVVYAAGLFVAVADTGTNRVMTSPDGITWTARTPSADNQWLCVTYGGSLFVAGGTTAGVGNHIMTSPDGITWTARTLPLDASLLSIAHNGTVYFAGNGYTLGFSSTDAITWTQRVVTGGNGNHNAMTVMASVFYIAGTAGTVSKSADGITWTSVSTTTGSGTPWAFTNYNGLLYNFYSQTNYSTSPDGVTWTAKTWTGISTLQKYAVASSTMLVVVGGTSTNPIKYSSDGTAFTTATVQATATAGTHLVRYRWYDPTNNRYSDPSIAISVIVPGTGRTTIYATACSNVAYSQVVFEATLASGSEYFQIQRSTALSVDLPTDLVISVQITANSYAGPDGYGHGQPPIARVVVSHRGRLFLMGPVTGNIPDMIYWSRVDYPDSWYQTLWARRGLAGNNDILTAGFGFSDDLYICGRQSMSRLVYTSDPANGMLVQLPTSLGAFNQNCVITADQKVFGWGVNGIWQLNAIQPVHFSQKIDPFWKADVDFSQVSKFFADFDPQDRTINFYYAKTGETGCHSSISFDLDGQRWLIKRYLNTVACAALVSTSTGGSVAYIADNDGGYVWQHTGNGYGDCLPTGSTNGAFTASAGSTTTVINLSGAPGDVVGAMAYFPATSDARRVTASVGATITITPALSAIPATSSAVYIGSVDIDVMSDWNPIVDAVVGRARAKYLMIENMGEDAAPELQVSFQADFNAANVTISQQVGSTTPNGVTAISGNVATVDMSPFVVAVPVPSDYRRVIRSRVRQLKPAGMLHLMDARFSQSTDSAPKERSQA